jgi:ribonuclease P protein component
LYITLTKKGGVCKATLKQFTLNKEERLKSRKLMDELFVSGQTLTVFPFRLVWLEVPLLADYPAQMAVSVSKRNFKHAVDRNRLKRLMREAYRKNKFTVYDMAQSLSKQYAIMLIYTGRKMVDYAEVESKIIITLKKFTERCNETAV